MEKRYWLRGGLIALGLYVFIGLLLAFYELGIAPQNEMSGLGTVLYLVGPGLFIFGIDGPIEYVPSFISSLAIYFFLGTFVGFLYQKIKRLLF